MSVLALETKWDTADAVEPAEASRLPNAFTFAARLLVAAGLRTWFRTYQRLTIEGREHLPTDRSFILVANHCSHIDTLCLLSALPLRQSLEAFPLGARDTFCVNPLRAVLAWLAVNVLPIDRHSSCGHGLRRCEQILERPAQVLIVFPEGTRGNDGKPGEFKPGIGLLTAGRDVPVVPCYLWGTRQALPKGSWLPRRGPLRLTIGAPRTFSHLPPTRSSRTAICRELRNAVMTLAPPLTWENS